MALILCCIDLTLKESARDNGTRQVKFNPRNLTFRRRRSARTASYGLRLVSGWRDHVPHCPARVLRAVSMRVAPSISCAPIDVPLSLRQSAVQKYNTHRHSILTEAVYNLTTRDSCKSESQPSSLYIIQNLPDPFFHVHKDQTYVHADTILKSKDSIQSFRYMEELLFPPGRTTVLARRKFRPEIAFQKSDFAVDPEGEDAYQRAFLEAAKEHPPCVPYPQWYPRSVSAQEYMRKTDSRLVRPTNSVEPTQEVCRTSRFTIGDANMDYSFAPCPNLSTTLKYSWSHSTGCSALSSEDIFLFKPSAQSQSSHQEESGFLPASLAPLGCPTATRQSSSSRPRLPVLEPYCGPRGPTDRLPWSLLSSDEQPKSRLESP